MDIRAWTLLWVVRMAAPALASGPADTAARAEVRFDTIGVIRKRQLNEILKAYEREPAKQKMIKDYFKTATRKEWADLYKDFEMSK